MNVRDLVRWRRPAESAPASYRTADENPFLALHREVNRLFDDVFRTEWPAALASDGAWSTAWPRVEVAENDREIRVTAEVPGLTEKELEVLLEDGVLILRGERKSEVDDQERQFSERFYGRFERRIAVGQDIDEDKVAATFKNGLVTVKLPKSEKAQSRARRIALQ